MAEFDPKKIRYDLTIDSKYYNSLYIEGFSHMMSDPSYCYKFFWLEALVQIISEGVNKATYDDVIRRMIVNAWYPVIEYHIHLSGLPQDGIIKDNLEKAVIRLKELSNAESNASKDELLKLLENFCKDNDLSSYKKELTKNVPHKALSGFANNGPSLIDINSAAKRMMIYYNKLNDSEMELPYTFVDGKPLERVIIFGKTWMEMIQDNTVAILGWIQFEKTKWLQKNNPEVPGLVYKLAPDDGKTRKLDKVKELWKEIIKARDIIDVFTGEVIIPRKYDIDHFIPWSFVMNDELWNLMPMDSSLNSVKSNKLPKWEPFFGKFAGNQYLMYEYIHENDAQHNLLEKCYKDNLHSIWAGQELYRKGNSKEEFITILEKNMRPVYDSARRQGYEIWQ